MLTCSNGHDSETTDYCSVCGEKLDGAPLSAAPEQAAAASAAGAPPAGSGPSIACKNCSAAHGPDDVFCESCGLDFATGTLPDEQESLDPKPSGSVDEPTMVVVSVDQAWAAQAIGGTDLAVPADHQATSVSLKGTKALVGRGSKSRGIFPEVDIEQLTDDPAVSSRHAMIEHDDAGNWTITDLGSTNGTVVGDPESDAVAAGDAVALTMGQPVFIGAWTRLELQRES